MRMGVRIETQTDRSWSQNSEHLTVLAYSPIEREKEFLSALAMVFTFQRK
jgi:hypothetical protein